MRRYKGTWTARVQQDFEIEAVNEAELDRLMGDEMHPTNVVELLDFEYDIEDEEDLS
jgi:hypothetical protein